MLNPFGSADSSPGIAIFTAAKGRWLNCIRFNKRAGFVRFVGFEISCLKLRVIICKIYVTELAVESKLDRICANWAELAIRQNLTGAAASLRIQILTAISDPD